MKGHQLNSNQAVEHMNTLFAGNNGIADVPIRLAFGAVFVAHGAQKLFGWWGGYGLEASGQWMASIGLEPGLLMAALAGGIEFFGGFALILGVLTRLVALVSSLLMLIALALVHWSNGFFIGANGYEFALALLAMSAYLSIAGSGRLSIDAIARKV